MDVHAAPKTHPSGSQGALVKLEYQSDDPDSAQLKTERSKKRKKRKTKHRKTKRKKRKHH